MYYDEDDDDDDDGDYEYTNSNNNCNNYRNNNIRETTTTIDIGFTDKHLLLVDQMRNNIYFCHDSVMLFSFMSARLQAY